MSTKIKVISKMNKVERPRLNLTTEEYLIGEENNIELVRIKMKTYP
jgi:hypothetical protein